MESIKKYTRVGCAQKGKREGGPCRWGSRQRRGEHPTPERWRRPAMALPPCPGRDALPAVGGLHEETTQLPGFAALCSVTTRLTGWLVAMAGSTAFERQAGWFSGPSRRGWVWGEDPASRAGSQEPAVQAGSAGEN